MNYHRFKHLTFSQSLHLCPTKPTAAPHIFFPVLLRNDWYTNCPRFRHVQHDGLIYRYCEMMTTGVQLTAIVSYRHNKKKKRKREEGKGEKIFLVMRTLRLYSPTFLMGHISVLALVILLYITSPAFIYLITGSLYYLMHTYFNTSGCNTS